MAHQIVSVASCFVGAQLYRRLWLSWGRPDRLNPSLACSGYVCMSPDGRLREVCALPAAWAPAWAATAWLFWPCFTAD